MKNAEIARVFQEIAGMLEVKGDNIFKIRAYRKASAAIENLPGELEQMARENRLKEVPGVGETIAKKISELVSTGRLDYYQKLSAEFSQRQTGTLYPDTGGDTTTRDKGEQAR
ncbi:MAG: hypothetical protein WC369_09100 [Dehalococcoidales bacterium]|jgi:DNA polymerase (family 10)